MRTEGEPWIGKKEPIGVIYPVGVWNLQRTSARAGKNDANGLGIDGSPSFCASRYLPRHGLKKRGRIFSAGGVVFSGSQATIREK